MKRRKVSAIVPRAVFGLVTVGVVPVCVSLAHCGGAHQDMNPVAATGFATAPPVFESTDAATKKD